MSARRHRGFTLIEVLVALVIVAVGMAALMGALSSSARTVTYMQDKTFAEWVALNKIATMRVGLQQGQIPPVGTTNGDVDFANRSWHWRQDVVASQVPGINRIDVKVRPKEIKGGDDDSWYVTMSGLAGNAMAAPGTGATPVNWDPGLTGGTQGAGGTGTLGTSLNQNGQSGSGTGNGTLGGSTNPNTPNPTTPTVPRIGTPQ
jgi:general secretion pathway protein I